MKKEARKNNRILLIIGSVILLCIIILGILAFKKLATIEVIFKDDLTIEINDSVYIESLIKEVKNGSTISENIELDTTKLGKQDLTIKVKNKFKEEEVKFSIEVIDTIKPTITCDEKFKLYIGKDLDLKTKVVIEDNSKELIEPIITGEYNNKEKGEYKLMIEATDSSNNKSTKEVIVNVEIDPNNHTFTTSKGFQGEVKNGITYIEGTLIANKTYKLTSSYGNGITKETTTAFNKMVDAAKKEGHNVYITSGFRSYKMQTTIYNNYVKTDGKKNADTYSARPGHSEHQTGLAIDINQIKESFGYTETGKWVNNNCYKYGFILRYPKGKDKITGYIYEPWHLRYVGVDLATKLYNNGNWITLEEYFGIDSKYSE